MQDTLHILNWADYVIIGVIGISVLISLIRGFVREILSLVVWLIAFFVAFKFCGRLADIFIPYTQNVSLRITASFTILFLIALILGGLISYLITVVITRAKLSLLDRTFGMIFGFARGVLIISILLLLVSVSSAKPGTWWTESYLIPHFQRIVKWMQSFLPAELNKVSDVAVKVISQQIAS
ncbi:MAG: hypothetical protein AMJ43_01900 [Coxiella sp. DG_40]|nr:MAG: hypothetical protein AMJ43_01900 [Coxiella sp. DG_40]